MKRTACFAYSLVVTLAVFLPATLAAGPVREYAFETDHTTIGFSIRYVGIFDVQGRFTEFSGRVVIDDGDITQSSVELAMQTSSIDTGVEKRDKHLRGADFFDVDTYPTINFTSTAVRRSAEGLIVNGRLTMHGVTKEISIPFTLTDELLYPWTTNIMRGVQARIELDRHDFGVGAAGAFRQVMTNGSAWASSNVGVVLDVTLERSVKSVIDILNPILETEGADAAIARYQELQKEDPDGYDFDLSTLSRLAYEQLKLGKMTEAITFFDFAVKEYATSSNAWCSLAEAHMYAGNDARAEEFFNKSLALNPDNENATHFLKRMHAE